MSSTPASSPCEPALGWSETCGSPAISRQRALELATSAPARPARARGPAAGAGGRCRAAPRRARAASGCASSCTSRAGRSPCRGRSCASRAGCSGGRSRARRPRAASAARRGGGARGAARRAALGHVEPGGRRTRAGPRRDCSKIVDRAVALLRRLAAGSCGHGCSRVRRARRPPQHRRRAGRCPACERCSVIATSRPSSSASGKPGVDALGRAALDHAVDRRVERDRELAHDRLLVQRARRRRAPSASRARRRCGCSSSSPSSTMPAPAEPAQVDRRPASALSACAVQMLWVAFSRRMCCSRVCSVSTKPRRPSTSVVSPAIRPGMRRR